MLATVFGAPFAATLAATPGCDKPAARRVGGDLLGPSVEQGHRLRQRPSLGDFDGVVPRHTSVAIVGGGAAALAAAWRLTGRGVRGVEILELEANCGGTAASGASRVTAYPWGAHYITVPMAHNRELISLLEQMGAVEGRDAAGDPRIAEQLLVREPKERVYYKGFWYQGLYPHAGATASDLDQLARFERIVARHAASRDAAGRRAFAIPLHASSDDSDLLELDRVSAAAWLDRERLLSPRLRWTLDKACSDDYGVQLSDTSAWAMLFYFAARLRTGAEQSAEMITWPEGNAALIAHMHRRACADRKAATVHTRRLVVDVDTSDTEVRIYAYDLDKERPELIVAKHAIVAVPRFIARRVVRRLREQPPDYLGEFQYGAWLIANLHLRSRPAGRGYPPAWDNLIYDSPGLGYVSATHQRGREHGPTVWTYYLPMTDGRAADGRKRLFETSRAELADAVVTDLKRAHPDLESHLARVDVWRWGHGMVQPRPGLIGGGALRAARAAIGRIHFAHTDLSGLALFEEAFHHGLRAADETIAALPAAATGHGTSG